MNTIIKSKSLTLFTAVILMLSIFSCEKNAMEPEKERPPELPPVESMQINLSFFDSLSSNSLEKTALTKHNFIAAAWRIFIINTTFRVAAIVPTAVFLAALSEDPVLKDDGKFHWIYTTTSNSDSFTADLAGWVDRESSEVVWEMYVSSNTHSPKLDNFLWYEGRAKIGNKQGWWMFHDDKSPDALVEVLKIDWQIPNENYRELILSNLNQANEGYGDSLKYIYDNFNEYLIFIDASQNNSVNTIYWDSQTGAGYIEWFDYNEGNRSYWDENQNDSEGPPA